MNSVELRMEWPIHVPALGLCPRHGLRKIDFGQHLAERVFDFQVQTRSHERRHVHLGNNVSCKQHQKISDKSNYSCKDITCSSYKNDGVLRYDGPPNSWGYLIFKKKYKWPTRMPTSEYVLPLERIKLNASRTHGKYIALNRVPNQKLTITSLFNWHQMYSTDKIIGSIRNWNRQVIISFKTMSYVQQADFCTCRLNSNPIVTQHNQLNSNRKK